MLVTSAIEFATRAGTEVMTAMVRYFQDKDNRRHGDLMFEAHPSGSSAEVYYIPPSSRLVEHGFDPGEGMKYKMKLLEFDIESGQLTIFPINTMASGTAFLKPKYSKVRKITLVEGVPVFCDGIDDDVADSDISSVPELEMLITEMLEDLPPAFTKDYDYGLGLAKPYRFIVEAIEAFSDCMEIVISEDVRTRADEATSKFYINTTDFDTIRKMLNSTTRMGQIAGRSVKEAQAHNFFAEILGHPLVDVNTGRHRLRKLFTKAMLDHDTNLSEDEQDEVIGIVTRNMRSISQNRPDRLIQLKNDLELANLESFISRFHEMLVKRYGESTWQKFFDANPLILSLAFGYPIIKVKQQASVGGRKLSGGGEKIADFLTKNKMTNNTAIVEIKTPSAKLVTKKQLRNGVFSPSSDLSKAIVQVLDQRFQFQREIFGIKAKSRIDDIETYAVQCCLLIGKIPEIEDEKKSFELFRGNSKDVQILTFDELLEKLVQLKDLLVSPEDDDPRAIPEMDIPF